MLQKYTGGTFQQGGTKRTGGGRSNPSAGCASQPRGSGAPAPHRPLQSAALGPFSHPGKRDNKESVQIFYSSQVTLTTYYFMEHLQIILFLVLIFRYTCSPTPPGLLKGRFLSHTHPPFFAQQSGREHAFPTTNQITTLKTIPRSMEESLAST